MMVHIVQHYGDNKDGTIRFNGIDGVYASKKDAEDYLSGLDSYHFRGETHKFKKTYDRSPSYRSVVTDDDWSITFKIIAKEVNG